MKIIRSNVKNHIILYSLIVGVMFTSLLEVASFIAYLNDGIVVLDFDRYGENALELFVVFPMIIATMVLAVILYAREMRREWRFRR